MFRYPRDQQFQTMTPKSKIMDRWYGTKFAAAPRKPDPAAPWDEGALLVAQYVEGYVYRTYGLRRMNAGMVAAVADAARAADGMTEQDGEKDYPPLESLMNACVSLGYVRDGGRTVSVGYVKNQPNDLKYFVRQYGQLILETNITSATHSQHQYTIADAGEDLGYDDYSKGFIMYGYNSDYIYLQNSLGPFAGQLGFHRMPWSVVPQLVLRGACWKLENPS